jgi:hypothetical protein
MDFIIIIIIMLAACLSECTNIKGDSCNCVFFTEDFLLLVCVKCITFYSCHK